MAAEDGTLAFTPFFTSTFSFFIIIWRFWISRLAPYLLVFRFSFCIHNQALAFGELAERQSVQQKKKKIPERSSLYSPRIADHVLLVWTAGQQWANGKRPPDPPFSYILSGGRGLCSLIQLFFYSNKEGWRHRRTSYNILEQEGGEANKETGWAGLDWIGVGHFGNGRGSLVLLSWVDHGPPAFGHFFIFFEFLDNKRKGEKQTESGSFSSSCGFWAGIALRTFVCDVGLLFCRVVRLDEMPNQSLVLGLLLLSLALPALLPAFCFCFQLGVSWPLPADPLRSCFMTNR